MPLRNLVWMLMVPAIVALGLAVSLSAPPPDKDYQLVRQIVDVLAEVDANYVRELKDEDRQKLVEDMIDGGLRQLDPYSEYMNPKKREEFKKQNEGHFGGVGISLGIDPKTNLLKVDHPMPGTPAYDAGVLADDLIVRVGDKSTEGMSIPDARKIITGEVGTPVTITTRREGRVPAEQDITLTRAKIEMHPVVGVGRRTDDPTKWEWFADKDSKIALIRLQTFTELTTKELRAAVDEIEKAGGRAIILDLRDNPGGLLNQAIDVVDAFLEGGKIVSTKDRRGGERSYAAKGPGTMFIPAEQKPMAVLINRNSASASEIVAAALQDHKRAVVVGERSYGKGSVQKLLELSDGAALKLTTESYWRPSGANIHRYPNSTEADDWGVKPTPGLEVSTTDAERLRYMWEMRKLDFVPGKPGTGGKPVAPPQVPKGADGKPVLDDSQPFEDKVLNKAVEHLKKQLGGFGELPPAARPAAPLPPRIGA